LAAVEGGMTATLEGLKKAGFMLVIVDTPPALTQHVTDAVMAADLVLIPVQPRARYFLIQSIAAARQRMPRKDLAVFS
jgi:cellulose biosynthesis protein BcsQ